jgi:hypothetical protein
MRQVSGRVAVVLGAASGVGRALATRFELKYLAPESKAFRRFTAPGRA